MNRFIKPSKGIRRSLFVTSLATFLLLALWTMASADSTPLSVSGWLDHSYNPTAATGIVNSPTGEKPESKLWWNDGYWWGNFYKPSVTANPLDGENHIYRLNWGTQTWEDTGVVVDTRDNAKADVLWDQANNTLYIASHGYRDTASPSINQNGKLFKYTYNPLTQTYTQVAGFPKDKAPKLASCGLTQPTVKLWVRPNYILPGIKMAILKPPGPCKASTCQMRRMIIST
ncbi:MAG: hypothetical protein NT075_28410 [Chloroflexi bacterium]|nr:hypothetical protein [Chloroflexota bacterium]